MNDLVLREAVVEDAAAIVSILHAAFAEYRGALNPPSGVHKESVESVRQRMQTARWVLAAPKDGAGAGGCVLYEPNAGYMYLGRLAVLPEFRGRGLANTMIEYVEAQARRANYTRVRLGVRVALPEMRALYERRGYHFFETRTHAGFDAPTYVILEKGL